MLEHSGRELQVVTAAAQFEIGARDPPQQHQQKGDNAGAGQGQPLAVV